MSRRQGALTSTDAMEIAILSGVVGVLVTVHFFLPEALRSQFLFTYGEPTVVSAWTAAILHDSVSHLASSVTWYAIVMASAYALTTTWKRRRPFWLAVVGCLVLAPPMTKLGDYWLLKLQWNLVADATTARGFSGVVSAFGGLLSFYEERIPAFTPGVNPTTLTQSITDGRLDIPRTSTPLS